MLVNQEDNHIENNHPQLDATYVVDHVQLTILKKKKTGSRVLIESCDSKQTSSQRVGYHSKKD